MSTVIKVENLSKLYQLGQVGTGTMSNDLKRWWHRVRGKEDPFLKIGEENDRTKKSNSDFVWALQDINFNVKDGEVLGIIGRNGAGKSTLLKILSRTTAPTTGAVKIKGRIASLLEVGTGFHPELSGRQNVFLNGAILGMTRAEISKKFDEIVDFAGVERYIDTPVKRYSSGMYVRLAFGVAAHLEPEILIVDEVLAVGDAEFQKKCLGKMKDVSVNQGRTVLFVSHNMDAIARLCDNCMYLTNGYIKKKGTTSSIINSYLQNESSVNDSVDYTQRGKTIGSNMVKLLRAEMIGESGENKANFLLDEKIGIKFSFAVLQKTKDLVCGFNLFNNKDVHLLSSHDNTNPDYFFTAGIYNSTLWIPENLLTAGIHYCGIAIMSYNPFIVHFHEVNSLSFHVVDKKQNEELRERYTGDIPGVLRPQLCWEPVQKTD